MSTKNRGASAENERALSFCDRGQNGSALPFHDRGDRVSLPLHDLSSRQIEAKYQRALAVLRHERRVQLWREEQERQRDAS